MTDLSIFRKYESHELGKDGYPLVWHRGLIPTEDLGGPDAEWMAEYDTRIRWVQSLESRHGLDAEGIEVGVKHLVRMGAGHRCVRCGHPFLVGTSGVMEGPCAEGKALAAEWGMDQEQLDHAFNEYAEDITEDDIARAPRTNWSPCDERCTHDGRVDRKGKPTVRWEFPRVPGMIHQGVIEGGEILAPIGEHLQKSPGMRVDAAWRILTVHHLNGLKNDLRWWNLIAVCQRCHLYLQRIVQMERVYPFEHDDYFKPYAAGWYAAAYLNEDLTREQTMARVDELLALERMA